MSYRIEVDVITPDKTKMFFRGDGGAAPDYWEIELITEPHRSYRSISFNGWHVASCDTHEFIEGIKVTWRVWDATTPIPDEVLSHLPHGLKQGATFKQWE